MSTVDEIIASGRYTDRRGRVWKIVRSPLIGIWWGTPHTDDLMLVMHQNKMRLLIERDLHECDGMGELPDCQSHPVPIVIVGYDEGEWGEFRVRFRGSSVTHSSHPDAMDAARALAVGE